MAEHDLVTATGMPEERPRPHDNPAKATKPFLVRFETARRHILASKPGLTEEDVVWTLWDAVKNRRLTAEIPYHAIEAINLSAINEKGRVRGTIQPRDDASAMRAASFSEHELLQLFPPEPPKSTQRAAFAAHEPFGADDPDPWMHPLEAAQWVGEVCGIPWEVAARDLERAHAEGRLSLTGRHRQKPDPQPVPPDIWAHYELDLLDGATRARSGREREPAWRALRFRRAEVLDLQWREPMPDIEAEPTLAEAVLKGSGGTWVPSVLACGKVARATGYPEAAAAEWLRQAANSGQIRVRYRPAWHAERAKNRQLEAERKRRPDEYQLHHCVWQSAARVLKLDPQALTRPQVVLNTEWHEEELIAALAQEAAAGKATPGARRPADRKGIGGAPRKYDWDTLGAAFGAWLNEELGRDRLGEEAHMKALATLATEIGTEIPDRSTAQPYLARWLKGYRAFLRSDKV